MSELTPINSLLNKPDSLVRRSPDTTTIALRSNERSAQPPAWGDLLIQIAQDKRHDLAPGILAYWKRKLSDYRDEEICQALHLYTGQFFPSVDDIIRDMDRMRERRWEEKQAQPPKEDAGKIPATQADYDELKRKAREIFAKASKANDLQHIERNRKLLQQSKVLGAES